jgi:hypothetical protein
MIRRKDARSRGQAWSRLELHDQEERSMIKRRDTSPRVEIYDKEERRIIKRPNAWSRGYPWPWGEINDQE